MHCTCEETKKTNVALKIWRPLEEILCPLFLEIANSTPQPSFVKRPTGKPSSS